MAEKTLLFELEAEYERHALRRAEQELLSATAQFNDMETGKRPEEVAMAEAQLNQAKAEAANAAGQLRRHESLVKSGGISRRELDNSRAAARTTAARVVELISQVEVYNLPEREKKIEAQRATVNAVDARTAQARWELEQKRVRAPAAGLVHDTLYRVGEWVSAGNPVVQLLPPGNIKVRFFVPETLAGGLRIGSRVLVRMDGRADPFPAVISYIAANAEYTPPIIYSDQTRSKLTFMVEAKPELEIASSLHPGQPVSVSLP
ncbi:MAG: HlyD family efflux transporter periplasmic adaptor subunit [Desulfovibrio sp.]|nr:HlyD family efflux transporter periplasmic adaptor subunit [Desulfovibrio sp.]